VIPASDNYVKFGYMNPVPTNITLNADDGAVVLGSGSKFIDVVAAGVPTTLKIIKADGSDLNGLVTGAGGCVGIKLSSHDSNMVPANITGSPAVVTVSGSGANLYSNSGCSVPLSGPISMGVGGNLSSVFYIKAPAAGHVGVYADSASPIMSGMHGFPAGAAGKGIYFGISSSADPIPVNSCVTISVGSKDGAGNPAPISATAATSIELMAYNGNFYSVAGCGSGGTPSYSGSIAANANALSTGPIYFKTTVGGGVSMRAYTTGSGPYLEGHKNFVTTP
jgi:hypothetical protein